MTDIYTYSKRVALTAAVVLLVAAGFYMLGRHGYFFLLVFAGILLAVLFSGIAEMLQAKLHLKDGLALLFAVLLFFGIIGGAIYLVAPTVGGQVKEFKTSFPEALSQVENWLSDYSWGQQVIEKVPNDMSQMLPKQQALLSRVTTIFSSTLSILADLLIVIVTALFLAANPKLYTVGFTKLFAVRHRSRIMQVLGMCYHSLKLWLLAMFLAMAVVGVSTAVGYSLLGLPLPFALALIAFLFAFVPNVGPLLAGVPAVLIGLTVSPQMALYVLLLYAGIQLVESYMLTPIIFHKTVDLPPALLLFFQVLLGLVQGALGLLLAAPLLAVLMVVINELYVKDVLERAAPNAPADAP
ncbi:AI-2E family transporter [Pontibacter akesuensis]|uniref:Predicted PurR-regulated permease PerM n=1 Tax=Pontibacter akesuensis TaxID=388950 RepID=A0A1I7GVI8_9BACT|nr:AI-2E family transporter [Pontibacter akesuensis]GHA54850.1 AI-2E family transporter [Pontibacter akesuensis]SFU52464.1 Predicted PurR-regulated permease PerM [Pontibacter akesuensis]